MTVLFTIPLVMTAASGVALTYFVFKRKSLAQSICVNQAAKTQLKLQVPLEKLLNMNPRASSLRAKRLQAETRLQQALLSGNPAAISAAKVARQVVILEQGVFHSRQRTLLADAERIRSQSERELKSRTSPLAARSFKSQKLNALAVKASPAGSPSPDYILLPNFEFEQQHRFRYELNVLGNFPFLRDLKINGTQPTECSVTLSHRSGAWKIQILAAKAP